MKVLTCSSTGQSISLTKRIASSGEGEIWETSRYGYLAKVYHSPHQERVKKLEVMVAHPPKDPNSHANHFSFAWPKSLLKDHRNHCVGFLMPAIRGGVQLLDIYNPQRRKKLGLAVNWYFLHTTALNIASIIQAIHARSYVLGDIKPQNLLVNNRALVSIIDTDSFQVRHPTTGVLYRCLVGSEGFTPVELLGKDLATVEQTEVHDRFRLAIIIYLLLFGNHPFQGRWIGQGDPPEVNELIRRGFWPYAPNSLIRQGPMTIPLEVVHPQIKQSFLRCFNDGQTRPASQPTAEEWAQALQEAIAALTVCGKTDNHYYSRTYGKCYWCERAAKLGVDIFADRQVITPQRRQPSSPLSAPAQYQRQGISKILPAQKHQAIPLSRGVKATISSQSNQTTRFFPTARTILWGWLGLLLAGYTTLGWASAMAPDKPQVRAFLAWASAMAADKPEVRTFLAWVSLMVADQPEVGALIVVFAAVTISTLVAAGAGSKAVAVVGAVTGGLVAARALSWTPATAVVAVAAGAVLGGMFGFLFRLGAGDKLSNFFGRWHTFLILLGTSGLGLSLGWALHQMFGQAIQNGLG